MTKNVNTFDPDLFFNLNVLVFHFFSKFPVHHWRYHSNWNDGKKTRKLNTGVCSL